MLTPKTLLLVANPWAAIDEQGRPCGACPRDPAEDNGALGYVGARVTARLLKAGSSKRVGTKDVPLEYPEHDRTWVFNPDPVRVPNTGFYRDRAGKLPYELFPGDAQTAAYLGYRDFTSAAKLIEAEKQKRIAEFDDQHGPGSWQQLEDERNPKPTVEVTPPADETVLVTESVSDDKPAKQRGKS
jgi:hypothetical protein